jgi:hypothetical protein
VHKDTYTKHCHICLKCISDYDHHCIWINNCVGRINLNVFIIFLAAIVVNLILNYLIGYKGIQYKFTKLAFYSTYPSDQLKTPYPGPLTDFWSFLYSTKNIMSILIMCLSICFLVPVW